MPVPSLSLDIELKFVSESETSVHMPPIIVVCGLHCHAEAISTADANKLRSCGIGFVFRNKKEAGQVVPPPVSPCGDAG
jgi:hypothetical protein